jgi:hypothetical protein
MPARSAPSASDQPGASPAAPALPALADAGPVLVALPVAEEPPAPKETFEQRAPEVRSEVLEKMGGSAETERAVGLALEWFARHQSEDGRWSGHDFDQKCAHCKDPAQIDADGAMTGLSLLCYLGAGHTPDRDGPYRANVSRAIEFLLARQDPSGDLRRGETMYSQSIATVALCEAYAMTRDTRIGNAARRAVSFMCEGVKRAAARRQDDRSRADDTSVLGWQVMAMMSARRSGFDVPETTFRSAAAFLDKAGTARAPGRYSYRPGEAPSAAMTAEAMFVRQLLGTPRTDRRMDESAAFILESPPTWREGSSTYFWYYATLALFEHQGDAWARWNESLAPLLLKHQRADGGAAGSWDPTDEYSRLGGRLYQTAVCTLSLEVYYRYSPAGTLAPAGR